MKHSYRPGADPFGLLCATVGTFLFAWGCNMAYAGHRVRAQVYCPPRAVAYSRPLFQQSYYPPIYSTLGVAAQTEALATKSWWMSEDYKAQQLRLAYLEGRAATLDKLETIAPAALQQAQQQAESTPADQRYFSADAQGNLAEQKPQQWLEDGQPAPPQQAQAGPPQQPMPPQQQMVQPNTMSPMLAPFRSRMEMIAKVCGSCHREGGKAEDYVRLDGSFNVLDPAECQLREAMFRRMISADPKTQMPPNKPLAPEALEQIVFELYGGQEAP